MASTNSLIITSIALCLCQASSLRLEFDRAPVDLSEEEEFYPEVLLTANHAHEDDIRHADKRDPSLRPALDQMLNKLNKPVVYFIGDSLVRNQWEGMCFLMNNKTDIDFVHDDVLFPPHDVNLQHAGACANAQGTMVHTFSNSHNPELVDKLLEAGAPQPDAIYWDAALWVANANAHPLFAKEVYEKSMHGTIDAYIKAAPRAKLVFFLSHFTCKGKRKGEYKKATPEIVKNINDMALSVAANRTDGQGRPILFVDGYSLTQDRCEMSSPDGRHFNKFVLDEVSLLFRHLQDPGWSLP